MKRVIILTGSRSLIGLLGENSPEDQIELLPLEESLSEDEAEIIEKNTGLIAMPVHYPNLIRKDLVAAIVDVTNPPVNQIM